MKHSTKLSYNYANCFFKTFKNNYLELIYRDTKLLKYCYDQDKDFSSFIKNIFIDRRKKQEAFDNIFEGILSKQFKNLVYFLFKNKKEYILMDVNEWIIKFYFREKQIKKWDLITTIPIDDDLEKVFYDKISKVSKSKNIIINKVVDPYIIGGFICRCYDKEIDGSVSKVMLKIKDNLS